MRVGLVGGTFNPIHLGHLLIAEEARERLGLEEIVFIPTGQPWMKEGCPLTPPHHRLNMIRLAIQANPFFRVSSMEMDRPGPTYTVDTLSELHNQTGGSDDLYLVLGVDSLREFPRWKQPEKILELCSLVASPRPGYPEMDQGFLKGIHPSATTVRPTRSSKSVNDPLHSEPRLDISDNKLVFLEGPLVDISGTEIRRRVSQGMSVRYQVPDDVERYIYCYGLYRDVELSR